MHLPRSYRLREYLEPGRVLVLYGPRRVGKTTLLQRYLSETRLKYKLVSGDHLSTQRILGSQEMDKLGEFVAGYELLAVDEAQHVPNIGMGLKILVDQFPDLYVIATGSASFALAGQIGEPLTGRKRTLVLYPLSQMELVRLYNPHELKTRLAEYLVFGSFPEVLTANTKERKRERLEELVDSYLFKDILALENVKSPKTLLDLLRLVAFQVGSEVSLSELGRQLGLNYKTVARYLDLFEKSFILYNLRGFSGNLRKEISKKSKYYFLDGGVRNAVIANFNDLNVRDDVGQLWENFLVTERLKKQEYGKIYANNYFWRTWDGQEVDWVEEREGRLFGYEFSYSERTRSAPRDWLQTYTKASFTTVHRQNYLGFVA
jgi:hypothetical protein